MNTLDMSSLQYPLNIIWMKFMFIKRRYLYRKEYVTYSNPLPKIKYKQIAGY